MTNSPDTSTHEVTFVVDHRLTDDEIDAFFDRVDDATPIRERGRTFVQFDRDADTLTDAVVTSLRDLEAAGFHASAVRSDDLVTPRQIAARTGRSYESVRTLAAGTRGPGGFPAPLQSEGWSLYSWAQVGPWFARHYPSADTDRELLNTEHDRIIAAADHLVRARAIMAGDNLAADFAALVAA